MEKQKYIAPELTIVSFKVEQGFQAIGVSLIERLDMFNILDEEYNQQGQENWTQSDDGYFGSGW